MINKIIKSSNYSKKVRKSKKIRFLIFHYTGMQSKRASIRRLTSPTHKVSCHYLIDRNGEIIQMVDDLNIAWHAGKSKWKNFENINENSIGIEIVNKGHNFGYENFTKKQINKVIKLSLRLKKKYKIKSSFILGHSDIAPLRKKDPGEKFPWKLLNKKGLGVFYDTEKINFKKKENKKTKSIFFKNIFKIGYRYFSKVKSKKKDKFVIRAFQRRFLPNKIDGIIDQKTLQISHFLAKNCNN